MTSDAAACLTKACCRTKLRAKLKMRMTANRTGCLTAFILANAGIPALLLSEYLWGYREWGGVAFYGVATLSTLVCGTGIIVDRDWSVREKIYLFAMMVVSIVIINALIILLSGAILIGTSGISGAQD